jgi:hypothetical protein
VASQTDIIWEKNVYQGWLSYLSGNSPYGNNFKWRKKYAYRLKFLKKGWEKKRHDSLFRPWWSVVSLFLDLPLKAGHSNHF